MGLLAKTVYILINIVFLNRLFLTTLHSLSLLNEMIFNDRQHTVVAVSQLEILRFFKLPLHISSLKKVYYLGLSDVVSR